MKRLNYLGIFFLACVMGLQVSGQEQFVFYVTDGTNNYFLSNNSGTLGNTSEFNATTCVFTGTQNSNESYTFTNGSKELRIPEPGAGSFELTLVDAGTTTNPDRGQWTLEPYGRVHTVQKYEKTNGDIKYYYLRCKDDGTSWQGVTKDDDHKDTYGWNYLALCRYVTVEGQLIEGNIQSNIVATGPYDYTATFAPSCPALLGYNNSGVSTTWYYYSNQIQTTPPPGTSSGVNYALSSNSYANISNAGVITVTSLPTAKDSITLTITASEDGVVVDTKVRTLYLYPAGAEIKETGIFGNKVILYDYEDHNWAYYAGYDDFAETTTANKYNTKYIGRIYSPDPRNVKITYRGGGVTGASAVAISRESAENQNEMIYYTTLEKYVIGEFTDTDNDGVPDSFTNTAEQYPYTVIPNPFSKRPRLTNHTGTTDGFYGFDGWKIISGAEYIQRASDKPTPVNNSTVLDLDEKIHFKNLPYGSVNCTSAEIVFEATWTAATVKEGNTAQIFEGGTYETNFLVITSNTTSRITPTSPCTIMGIYPDGTGTMHKINGVSAGVDNVKVEWVNSGTENWNARGHDFTIGRGVTTSTISNTESQFSGNNTNGSCANVVRIESGEYGRVFFHHEEGTAELTDDVNILAILGCDYDRAWAHPEDENDAYTNKLIFHRVDINGKSKYDFFRNPGQLYWRGVFKSGNHLGEFGDHLASSTNYTAGSQEQFYCAAHKRFGHRFLTVEGGRINGITGGSDNNEGDTEFQNGHRAFTLRLKGNACILGSITGAASSNPGSGDRVFIITGGKIGGWVAAGANGDDLKGGTTIGNSYVYIGGNARVNSRQFYTPHTINHSFGGIVYGAGCGMHAGYKSGSMEESTNVVLADNAYVERAIYGGGAYGQAANVSGNSPVNNVPANIYILGGHVGGVDGTNDVGTTDLAGGVFGGASLNHGCSSNIYMYGGIAEGGIYGGSNASGGMFNDVNVQILGGQVGTTTTTANIHGGGLGSETYIFGNVNVMVGKSGATTGATVYGDVYGGSAEGTVNIDTLDVTAPGVVTNVTLNAGAINGSLYGGGLGTTGTGGHAADVYGPVSVTVNSGEVTNVFGCNNANGTPKSSVSVTVNKTNPTITVSDNKVYAIQGVYGGGNLSNYAPSSSQAPVVVINNCASSIKDVYGGGNAAAVPATNVTINGGDIDRAFAGGNGESGVAADVNGNAVLTVHGGTINQVFGGSNAHGVISGTSSVTLTESDPASECFDIKEVFAGGNEAPGKGGSITVGCGAKLGDVYGGANKADIGTSSIPANITLNINGGNIDRVFGGNNTSGNIYGTITVNIDVNGDCDDVIGYVYGGGNQASYTAPESDKNSPKVNVKKGHVLYDVYGGGLGLSTDATKGTIMGNPQVKIYAGKESDGTTDNVQIDGNVFGGGNAGKIIGNTNVQVGVPVPVTP